MPRGLVKRALSLLALSAAPCQAEALGPLNPCGMAWMRQPDENGLGGDSDPDAAAGLPVSQRPGAAG